MSHRVQIENARDLCEYFMQVSFFAEIERM